MRFKKVLLSLTVMALVVGGLSLPSFAQEQRTKNFALVVDQSGEMNETYHNQSKNYLARKIAEKFINAVPKDLPIKGAVYMYGIVAAEDKNQILRIQNFTAFNRQEFLKALDELKPQMGPPSLSVVLNSLRQDLDGVNGRTSLIIISGGSMTDPGDPVKAARQLADVYKNICFYTVLIGKSKMGGNRLEDINGEGAHCGLKSTYEDLDSDKGMRRFVKHMFYKKTDVDEDDDGVPDKNDQCPNTPIGANVDSRGCWVLNDINFDVNKADIKPMYYDQLDSIAAVMNANPAVYVTIEGHTDSDGDDNSNQVLSEKRANSVKAYLINQGEVDAGRLIAVGKGESQPVADNATPAGKALNRRIEFRVNVK